MAETKLILALVNLVLGLYVAGVFLCRLNMLPPETPLRIATPYVLMLTGGVVSAAAPWLGQWPTGWQVGVMFCVCVYVTTSKGRFGTPC